MSVGLAKLFMRTISQNPNENQTGISLWTLQDVENAQKLRKEREVQAKKDRAEQLQEEEYDDGGFDDEMLANIDLDV